MSEDQAEQEQAGLEPQTTPAELAQIATLRAKLIQAELRTAAARAGMIDLDGIKLVDANTLAVNEAGEFTEATNVIARLRQEKPWLFGRASSSASALAPRAAPPVPKTAMEMTVEEWRVARAELLRRR